MSRRTPLEDARRERDEAQREARRLRGVVVLLLVITVCAWVGWTPAQVLDLVGP